MKLKLSAYKGVIFSGIYLEALDYILTNELSFKFSEFVRKAIYEYANKKFVARNSELKINLDGTSISEEKNGENNTHLSKQ